MGRPPLTEDEVRDKVLAYCERYQVSPGPEGLPPFPSGRRETRQHREWMTVYRARQRLRARQARPADHPPGGPSCPFCSRAVGDREAVAVERAGWKARARLHPACADLVRLARQAGPEAVARLSEWIWPARRGGRDGGRPGTAGRRE